LPRPFYLRAEASVDERFRQIQFAARSQVFGEGVR